MHTPADFEKKLKAGTITRREFIAGLTALGISTTMLPGAFTSSAFAADTPQKGGRFRFGLSGGSTTDTLDPGATTDTGARVLIYGTSGNNLAEVDANNNVVPELAESWESTPDAKKWIFKLRKGVEFHNGKSFDADDVIHSMDHHRSEKSTSGAKGIVKAITSITKEDKYTVVFELESGNADFPYLLTDYHFVMGPKGDDFKSGIFTGAYIIQKFEPGVRTLATKNPNYFKSDRGWFDEIELLTINDVNARTNALKTGQIDAINRCELKTVRFMKRLKDIEIMEQEGFQHFTFAMNTTKAPFDNKDVRLALKYGVDREQMVKTILQGFGSIGNDHPISRGNRFFAKDLPQRAYDPDKAKFHLKKAGLESLTVPFHTADAAFAGAVDAGVLYKEQAAKAGINIDVVREPNDGYWSNVWMKKPFCAVYWGGRPTEDMMFSTAYAKGAPWNDTFWDNAKFNELLVAARSELDKKKRSVMYADMQEITHNDGGVVIPMFSSDVSACNTKVGHGPLAVNWELDGCKAAERWWFKG